jgi:hypothetical protein
LLSPGGRPALKENNKHGKKHSDSETRRVRKEILSTGTHSGRRGTGKTSMEKMVSTES